MDFKYNYMDWGAFLPGNLRYRNFHREKSCIRFLKHQLECIDEYAKYIPEYPETQYESLEFFYECYRGVSALNEWLLDDLIMSRKTVGWGIWLALITPQDWQSYDTQLKSSINKYHTPYPEDPDFPNDLITKALEAINTKRPDDEFFSLSDRFKKYISEQPKLNFPLRKWPTEEDKVKINKYKNQLKKIYHQEGTAPALSFIKNNKLIWIMSYREWLQHIKAQQKQ